MKENQKEILKRKKIRKLLLLKINDELKEISKTKSNIKINSRTIQELNKLYNKNDILLFEKSIIYSNYIKTEETIISKNISPINITKTIDKIDKPKIISKSKNKKMLDNNIIFEIKSCEEDSPSPIINYVPKKIELGSKKFCKRKSKQRNNASIPKIQKLSDKEINQSIITKSTRLGGDIHLDRLIEKITLIKNNENTEGIQKIKENIKKLRKYCYQLRKKKKKVRGLSNNRENNKIRKKTKEKDDKFASFFLRRNTLTNKNLYNKTLSLFQKVEKNEQTKEKLKKDSSSPIFNIKINIDREKRTSKFFKINKIKSKLSIKNLSYFSLLKSKEKTKKTKKIIDEDEDEKIIKDKSNKKNNKKPIKTEEKNNNETLFPTINNIHRHLMRSSINILKSKIYNNNEEKKEKERSYMKSNKMKHNKKILSRITNINYTNNKENKDNKDNKDNKENESGLKYLNLNMKKDKIELHDNLIKKSSKNFKKNEIKKDSKKN